MLLFFIAMAITLLTALVLHLDDLAFDLAWILRRAKPKRVSTELEQQWRSLPQKRIAILIPCWQAASHLELMIKGNLSSLEYENYTLFLGVYSEDTETLAAAKKLSSTQVQVLQFSRNTINTKAKICNEMLRKVYSLDQSARKFEAFFLSDSDESWHPLTLTYANANLDSAPLLQIPVLAQLQGKRSIATATYADELAEQFIREIPLRHSLGASPSAFMGGLFLQRTLLTTLFSTPSVFSENLLAEAYQLARKSALLGFRVKSESLFIDSSASYLANRKFFPETIPLAVAQKSRIALGTSFQNIRGFFRGNWVQMYFFWRDRRGPWTTLFLALASLLVMLSLVQTAEAPPLLPPWMETISFANFFLWIRRVFVRAYCVQRIYGWKYSLGVGIRWPVGNFINSLSTWRALTLWRKSVFEKQLPQWTPREKRIPKEYLSLQA